jgi:hypothetical protein
MDAEAPSRQNTYMPHFISQCAAIHVLVSVLEAEACHLEASSLYVGLEAYHHEIQSLYMYLAFQEILLVFEYQHQTYVLLSNIHHTDRCFTTPDIYELKLYFHLCLRKTEMEA